MSKITVAKALEAYAAIDEIRGQKTNKDIAKKLYFLRKKLSDPVDFYNEQQSEIIKRIGLKVAPDGKIDFQDDMNLFMKYKNEIDEVRNEEIDIDSEEIDLSEEDVQYSEAFIEAVEGLIKVF